MCARLAHRNLSLRNPSVLLIQLYGPMQPPNTEPLSIEALAAALLNRFPHVHVRMTTLSSWDGASNLTPLIDRVQADPPTLIGVSIPQSTLSLATRLLNNLNQTDPPSQIVLGHALPTHAYQYFLQMFPQAIVVRGWGEDSLALILERAVTGSPSIYSIPNLAFLHSRKLHLTQSRWPSAIPTPLRLRPVGFFPRVEASRGCHYDVCTFCTRQPKHGGAARYYRRPPSEVAADIIMLHRSGVRAFTFTDEDFLGDDLGGAEAIALHLKQDPPMSFSLSLRADSILPQGSGAHDTGARRTLLARLRDAGLSLVYIGVESFSDSQLRRYGKGTTRAQMIRAVEAVKHLGIAVELGFILFDPLLTAEELTENITCLERTGLWADVGNLIHCLRPQLDSPMTRLLKNAHLLGRYDPDTMLYETSYLHPVIGDIKHRLREWYEEIDSVYLLTRTLQRTADAALPLRSFTFAFRSLFFKVLKSVSSLRLQASGNFDWPTVLVPHTVERTHLVSGLLAALHQAPSTAPIHAALTRACLQYLADSQASPFLVDEHSAAEQLDRAPSASLRGSSTDPASQLSSLARY